MVLQEEIFDIDNWTIMSPWCYKKRYHTQMTDNAWIQVCHRRTMHKYRPVDDGQLTNTGPTLTNNTRLQARNWWTMHNTDTLPLDKAQILDCCWRRMHDYRPSAEAQLTVTHKYSLAADGQSMNRGPLPTENALIQARCRRAMPGCNILHLIFACLFTPSAIK